MEAWRDTIVFGSVLIYMVMCIVVGLWAMRRTRSSSDFFMAGRELGVMVTAIAVFSSTMSGFGFVGGPGLVFGQGTFSFWLVIATGIGYSIAYYLVGKRIRLFAELCDSVSLPDVVTSRYSSPSTGGLTALAILLGVIGYLAAQVLAMAQVLQTVVASYLNLGDGGGSLQWQYAAISCAVLVFYCVTGGIVASVYTDLVQGLVMMVAALLVLVTAMSAVDGGFTAMSQTIHADDPEAIGPWGTLGMLGCLSFYFVFVIGNVGQPHVITKMMMTKKISDAKHMLPITVIGYGITALLWISIGLVMRTLVLQGKIAPLSRADAAAPEFLQSVAHPLLAGIVFAGLFAAIMSTADSFLNIGAAAVVHDIPKAITGKTLPNELFWARLATVGIALAAMVIALISKDLVAILGSFGWGTFASAIVPTVAIGFNWKRATPLAANVAMIASLSVIFVLKLLPKLDLGVKISVPYGILEGAFALLTSLTLFIGISLCSKRPEIDPDISEAMDL